MKTMLLATAVLMMTAAAPVFAADAPAKPATPAPAASPASPTPAAAPAKPMDEKPMAAKPAHKMKMVHKAKMMPMKKGMAPMAHPAKEATTDQLNQQQLDTLKK
jgi:hypothetical protein